MRIISLFILFSLLSCQIFAQKEGNIWYFGAQGGVDFNSGEAYSITDGAMSTFEGCATRCDENGNLLFYTDGSRVYNRNHKIMENGRGLNGNSSSTQSGIIVNRPGSTDIFYVFVVDWQAGKPNKRPVFTYSVVDMTLDAGLGAVTGIINYTIQAVSAEKVMAVQHHNGKDYWIVTHDWNSDVYSSYLLTSGGLNLTPVKSATGVYIGDEQGGSGAAAIGYLKANQEGNKVASVHSFTGYVDLLDFDNKTGKLSNALTMKFNIESTVENVPYGAEFSPDGHYLYIGWGASGHIYQYNALDTTAAGLRASEKLIEGTRNNSKSGAISLGPDGYIYHSLSSTGYLGVLYNPNASAENINYNNQGLFLEGASAVFGLPNFTSNISYVPPKAEVKTSNTCLYDSTVFKLNVESFDSVKWNFGEATSGAQNTSTVFSPKHQYASTGLYAYTLVAYKDTVVQTVKDTVEVFALPDVFLGNDTSFCTNDTIILDAAEQGVVEYKWQDDSQESYLNVTSIGTYSVEVTNIHGCISSDVVVIGENTLPIINLGADTGICPGKTLILDANKAGGFAWSTGATTQTINVNTPGRYDVFYTDLNTNCNATDTINVVLYSNEFLGNDTIICSDTVLTLASENEAVSYLWSTGETTETIDVKSTGTYYLDAVFGDGCMFSDTIEVEFKFLAPIDIGNDTTICDKENVVLDAGTTGIGYEWSTTEITQKITITDEGVYYVDVFYPDGCIVSDSMELSVLKVQDIGNDTVVCYNQDITLNAGNTGSNYLWSTGETSPSITVKDSGKYVVTVDLSPTCTAKDSILVDFEKVDFVTLGEDTVICKGASLTIQTAEPGLHYYWGNGEITPSITVDSTYNYALYYTSINGCFHYDEIYVEVFSPDNLPQGILACEDDTVKLGSPVSPSYLWSTGETTDTIKVTLSDTYFLTVTNKDGCQSTDSVKVKFNAKPDFSIVPKDSNLCIGDTVEFRSDLAEGIFNWGSGEVFPIVSRYANDTLVLTITNIFGCEETDTNIVFFNPLPVIDFPENSLFCENDAKVLDAGNPTGTFLWSTGETTQTINVKDSAYYYVEVISDKGCYNNDNSTVRYLNAPSSVVDTLIEHCLGEELTLSVYSQFANYLWSTGSTHYEESFSVDGDYSVLVSNVCGSYLEETHLDFIFCDCVLQLPNTFTPNSDGNNDHFEVVTNCPITDFLVRIYDRWGEIVYESTDPFFQWDGTYKSKPAELGVYNYIMDYEYDAPNRYTRSGQINIVR